MPLSIADRPKRSFSQIAKAEGVHVSTIWRWALNGVGGLKLRSVKLGGRRYVFDDDWNEFVAAGMDDNDETEVDAPSPKAEQAAAELEQAGF